MILEENKSEIAPHNAFVVRGFDYSELMNKAGNPAPQPIKSTIVSVKLRFFVNYAPIPLKKMVFYVCKCKNDNFYGGGSGWL